MSPATQQPPVTTTLTWRLRTHMHYTHENQRCGCTARVEEWGIILEVLVTSGTAEGLEFVTRLEGMKDCLPQAAVVAYLDSLLVYVLDLCVRACEGREKEGGRESVGEREGRKGGGGGGGWGGRTWSRHMMVLNTACVTSSRSEHNKKHTNKTTYVNKKKSHDREKVSARARARCTYYEGNVKTMGVKTKSF